jgi:hypothetical protein
MGAGTSVISSQGFNTLKLNINGSISQLAAYPSDPTAVNISGRYQTLLTSVNHTITDLTGMNGDVAAALQSSYSSQMSELDLEKDITLTRINGVTYGHNLRLASYIIGMILAIIIITNTMVSELWLYKLYYALWGAIFYPIVLLYGLYDPPVWRAILIPFYEISIHSPSYIKYLPFFTYNPPGAPDLKKSNNKTTLRVFTGVAVLFGLIAQMLP